MKKPVYTVVYMVIAAAIFTGAISFTHLVTRDQVKRNESLYLKKSILYTFGIAVPAEGEKVESLYQSEIQEIPSEQGTFFRRTQTGALVVHSVAPGLWGDIEGLVGCESNRERLTGIEFIKQEETPGLGAKIVEEWFKAQFRGKSGPFVIATEENRAEAGAFDGITGATITTKAVELLVNRGSLKLKELP